MDEWQWYVAIYIEKIDQLIQTCEVHGSYCSIMLLLLAITFRSTLLYMLIQLLGEYFGQLMGVCSSSLLCHSSSCLEELLEVIRDILAVRSYLEMI